MISPKPPETGENGEPMVPFSRLALFVRQVIHDVRNGLNSMDLQSAYVLELASDPEVAEEVRRLRSLILTSARQLQSLSGNFWSGNPSAIDYSARILIEDIRDRLLRQFPEQAAKVEWSVELGEETVALDLEMFFGALIRIFENAFLFSEPDGSIKLRAFAEDGQLVVELVEAKKSVPSDPAQWGEAPFISSRRGGYGLGLFRARRLLELNGATLKVVHDPERAELTSRVSLPLAPRA